MFAVSWWVPVAVGIVWFGTAALALILLAINDLADQAMEDAWREHCEGEE